MSDISQGGAPAVEAPAGNGLSGQSGTIQPGTAPTAPAADDLSPFGEHAGYIKQLRDEAAGYRTRAKELDVFGADEDRAVWSELAQLYASDPSKAAERFVQIGQGLQQQLTPQQEVAQAQAAAGDQPLTRGQLDQLLAEREQAATQRREVESIVKTVVDAGFAPNTPEHREVLFLAANETGGDIGKALEMQQARKQAIIDEFMTGKAGQRTPTVVTNQGGPASQSQPIRTFQDARAAAEARIRANPT